MLRTTNKDVNGRPVLMSRHVFPAHRTEFVVDLPNAEPSITPSGLRLMGDQLARNSLPNNSATTPDMSWAALVATSSSQPRCCNSRPDPLAIKASNSNGRWARNAARAALPRGSSVANPPRPTDRVPPESPRRPVDLQPLKRTGPTWPCQRSPAAMTAIAPLPATVRA